MSRPVARFLSFLLVLQLIIPYSIFAAAIGEFTSVAGTVTQTRAKKVMTPVVKSPIEMKDLIATAKTSSATMVFSDDSKITLSQNTKLEIKEFLFKDTSRTGIFSLAMGKMSADVKKHIGGNNVFEVRSPTAVVGVRGTGFEFEEAVTPEKMGKSTVSCTEGSLNLSALAPTGEVISTAVLEAGQVAVIIGGIITISAIAAAATGAAVAPATQAGTTGAAATGTGGAAATGMSTAAIAGIAVGGAAAVGVAAAAIGSSSSSSSGGSSPPVTVTGTWRLSGRCVGQTTDAFSILVTLNETAGGAFSGSGSGQDYDGTPMTITIAGNYNSTSKVLSATLTTNFSGQTCVRQDTFSTTLTSNDTGYINGTQSGTCNGCSSQFRMIKQ